jgi:hypothetical protein
MKAIWKYTIDYPFRLQFGMPKGAIVRHVDEQRNKICLWVEVDTENEEEQRSFFVIGTGHNFPKDAGVLEYLGTCKMDNGEYIFHVYESIKETKCQDQK